MKKYKLFFMNGEVLILQAEHMKNGYGELRFYVGGELIAQFGFKFVGGWMELRDA